MQSQLSFPRRPYMTGCRLGGLMLAAAIGTARRAPAQSALRDTVHVILVGRNESADVYLDFPAADTLRGDWTRTVLPDAISHAGPIHIRTVLPITVGTAQVSPGRYQLWTVGTDTGVDLILTRSDDSPTDSAAVPTGRARIPLQISQSAGAVFATTVTIRTVRHGADTLVVTDRSTRHMDIRGVQIHPATSSLLVISIGDAVLTVPISAR